MTDDTNVVPFPGGRDEQADVPPDRVGRMGDIARVKQREPLLFYGQDPETGNEILVSVWDGQHAEVATRIQGCGWEAPIALRRTE